MTDDIIYDEEDNPKGETLYTVYTFYKNGRQVGPAELYEVEKQWGDRSSRFKGLLVDFDLIKGRLDNDELVEKTYFREKGHTALLVARHPTALGLIRQEGIKKSDNIELYEQDYRCFNSLINKINQVGSTRVFNVILTDAKGPEAPVLFVRVAHKRQTPAAQRASRVRE